MKRPSLGLIETRGFLPAVEAVDAGMKAANVAFAGYKVTKTGLVTVQFVGDVAAVTSSVKAAAAAAGKVGTVVATHVIPRPDPQLGVAGPKPTVPPGRAEAPRPVKDDAPGGEAKPVDAGDVETPKTADASRAAGEEGAPEKKPAPAKKAEKAKKAKPRPAKKKAKKAAKPKTTTGRKTKKPVGPEDQQKK